MKFNFVAVMWGEHHVSMFLRVGLASMLTAGNLLAFAGDDASFDIYTTEEDAPRIQSDPAIAVLSNFMHVRIFPQFRVAPGANPYLVMNEAHRIALGRMDEDTAILFISADVAFSDGTFAHVRRHARAGKRAILGCGVHARREFGEAFRERFNQRDRIFAVAPPRELVDLYLQYRHPSGALFTPWNEPFTNWPSLLQFDVGTEGVIFHSFHLHPLLVFPRVRDVSPDVTMDFGYVTRAVPDVAEWQVVDDSDDIFGVDYGYPDSWAQETAAPRNGGHEPFVVQWLLTHTTPVERRMALRPILMHRGPLTEQWEEVARRSSELVRRLVLTADAAQSA